MILCRCRIRRERLYFRTAAELDMAARLFHEAIDHAQAKPAAHARPLRCIEGFEGSLPYFRAHPSAGIGHRVHYMGSQVIGALQDQLNNVDTLTLRREENDEIMMSFAGCWDRASISCRQKSSHSSRETCSTA